MGTLVVIVPSPSFDDDPGFAQAVEDLAVEQFVTKLAVEAFAIAVLPWAAWFDEQGLRSDLSKPVSDDPGSHLRAIVGTDVGRDAGVEPVFNPTKIGAAFYAKANLKVRQIQ
jgi:hypothetical protein